jgi:hypothetical protein
LATFRYVLHLNDPGQVRQLLASEGYEVEAEYGNYRFEPLTPGSPRAIFVTRPVDADSVAMSGAVDVPVTQPDQPSGGT